MNLVERVAELQGPSYEIDRLLAQELGYPNVYRQPDGSIPENAMFPAFTSSLNAAIALVEHALPGWACGFDAGPKTIIAFVDPHDHADRITGARHTEEGPTPAIALLRALLSASHKIRER